jgi:tetratricopeptide (TPR) repeat protein
LPEQLIHIDPRKKLTLLVTILVLALAVVWSVFIVRWYVGNTLAEYLNPDENGADMVRLAVSLAPNDPLSHWSLGDFTEKKLPPDQIVQAVKEYEKAVSLSPNDYRFWMAFGRALEQNGETERGEKALRRAVELAPSYAYPHWYLGNLLLRSSRYEEGFAELQRASDANTDLRPQLFNLAWEVYRDDVEAMKAAVGKSGEVRAQFALNLMNRGRIDDGLKVWGSLSEAEKRANRVTAESMLNSLITNLRFNQAAAVWNDILPNQSYRVVSERVLDGSFEDKLAHSAKNMFGWQVQSLQQAQVAIDPNVGHTGSRSLRILFQVRANLDSPRVSQLMLVQPNTQYELECYLKTQNLESAAMPILTITDPTDNAMLAQSPAAPTGKNDWQRVAMPFKTGPKTEAIVLRVGRASCGENTVCPMFGTIWYDDFSLKSGS